MGDVVHPKTAQPGMYARRRALRHGVRDLRLPVGGRHGWAAPRELVSADELEDMVRGAASIYEAIDDLISLQIETRPEQSDRKIRLFAQEARVRQGGMTGPAAAALLERSSAADCFIVSSGWYIPRWFPRGELCGVVGAVGLTRLLVHALGKPVIFPTEEAVVPVVESVCHAAGLRTCDWDEFTEELLPQVCVFPFSMDADVAAAQSSDMLARTSPGGIITVEKCGPTPSGVFHAGNGVDMSDTTARVDLLVQACSSRGVPSVGVGDLGNEIGFGLIRERALELAPALARCVCGCGQGIVSSSVTDHLVVGSSSNRGAMGLEAALGVGSGKPHLIHDGSLHVAMIEAAASAGAVDSFHVAPARTDGHGVPAALSGAVMDLLRFIADSSAITYPMYAARAGRA